MHVQPLSDFTANLSQKTFNLRQLTKENTYIFAGKSATNLNLIISEMFCIRTSYWHFSKHSKQHFCMFMDIYLVYLPLYSKVPPLPLPNQLHFPAKQERWQVKRCSPQLYLEALVVDFVLRHFCQYLIRSETLVAIFSNKHQGLIRTDHIKLSHQDISYEVVRRQGSFIYHMKLLKKPVNLKKLCSFFNMLHTQKPYWCQRF